MVEAARRQPEGGGSVGQRLPGQAFWGFPAPGTLGGHLSQHPRCTGEEVRRGRWWD